MRFRFAHHAEQELIRPSIPCGLLEQAVAAPQKILRGPGGRQVCQSQLGFGEPDVPIAHDSG